MFRIYRYDLTPDTASLPTIALADAVAPGFVVGDGPADPDALPVGWEWGDLDAPILASARPTAYNQWREFSLDFAGGDAIVAPGIGSAQGAQLLASDMLGNHIFFIGVSAAQAQDFSQLVDNFSAHVLYLNLSHRLNFGAGAFRFKGLFRDVTFNIYEEETYGGYFLASYPFSKFRRVELRLGLERSNRIDIDDA